MSLTGAALGRDGWDRLYMEGAERVGRGMHSARGWWMPFDAYSPQPLDTYTLSEADETASAVAWSEAEDWDLPPLRPTWRSAPGFDGVAWWSFVVDEELPEEREEREAAERAKADERRRARRARLAAERASRRALGLARPAPLAEPEPEPEPEPESEPESAPSRPATPVRVKPPAKPPARAPWRGPNRWAQACTFCGGVVPAGEGVYREAGPGAWEAAHGDGHPCVEEGSETLRVVVR